MSAVLIIRQYLQGISSYYSLKWYAQYILLTGNVSYYCNNNEVVTPDKSKNNSRTRKEKRRRNE